MASVDGVSTQVRRIAILVTSLDATAGRQLLLAMPSQLARDVRKAMAALTAVDPEERRRILAEFRSQALAPAATHNHAPRPTASASAASSYNASNTSSFSESRTLPDVTASALPGSGSGQHYQDDSVGNSTTSPRSGDDRSNESGRAWQRFDVPTLTALLRSERATVIAVVLSQLQPRQAVELLEQLPRPQHRSVITQLSRLGEIDPEAMQAIDEHLASRIADYGHRRASESESLGRIQELLAAASPEMRGQWQEIIAETDHQLADRLGIAPLPSKPITNLNSTAADGEAFVDLAAVSAAKSAATTPAIRVTPIYNTAAQASSMPAGSGRNAARARASDQSASLVELLGSNVVTTADSQLKPSIDRGADDRPHVIPFQSASKKSPGRGKAAASEITELEQILELPPHDIAQVLSAADGEVLLLALAGATPDFMQRFTALLERADARSLHARLRQLGAINLQDIDEAQRRLCELATQVLHSVRAARRTSTSVPAAA